MTPFGNFESLKVYLFFILLIGATVEMYMKNRSLFSKHTLGLFGGIVIFGIVSYLLSLDTPREFFFGIGEKQHGYLFIASIIWLGFLLSHTPKEVMRNIALVSTMTGCVVSIVAIVEVVFRYNLFIGIAYESSLRAISTLGNANYLAGYLLMLLPLVGHTLSSKRKIVVASSILALGIIASGSIIGITLMFLYFTFLIGRHSLWKRILWIFPAFVVIMLLSIYGLLHESEKWLSLTSRFVLMQETLVENTSNITHILFGNGPNALIEMYEQQRSDRINAYFPSGMVIDSSHSVLIDFFIKYGLIPLSIVISYLMTRWRWLEPYAKHSIILGFLFLSMNVMVVAHMILFVLFFQEKKDGP